MQLLIFRLWVLENLQKFVVHCISLFDIAYSLIVLKNARQDFDPYAHDFSVMNAIIPPHWIWMAKNDWTQQISTQCYQIYNGKWVYEYNNFFEMPVVPNPQKLPGRYPKDVPPEQQKYLRK